MNKHTIGLGELARIFLRTGTYSFGGWSTTALLLEDELVTKRKALTKRQLDGAVAYAQILPGATQVALTSNTGYKLCGMPGAFTATIFYLLPALSLITLFAFVYFRFAHGTSVMTYIGGLIAALGGIIMANAYNIARRHITHPVLWSTVVLALICKLVIGINVVAIIFAFGAVGLFYSVIVERRQKHD